MEVDWNEHDNLPPAWPNNRQIPEQPQNNQQVPEQLIMNSDEDPYKPEGNITMKIEKLSEFARDAPDSRKLSEALFIRGLPWRILAIPRENQRRPHMAAPQQKCLSYFLQCNADNTDPAWSCTGSATLKVLAQKEGKEDHVRKISHNFHAKENDWGFAQFMSFDSLMDLDSGWYDEAADAVILSVDVTADAPHGVNWDSKKDTECIGLKNQGATCYMNSILQTLFFTNKLRRAVYQMPTEEDNPDSSVALAMQRVFYDLQFSDFPVGTKKLTKSFGWDSIDSFLQNDVQEFCRVLLDNLENKMKNTKVVDTIPSLFKGRMKSYIKCKEVDFESSREECFYDIQLNVKNKTNVLESFKDYTEPESLDGDNRYDAGEYGLQPAEKGLKFLSFPPVLHLQLMRFQYDPLLDTNVKINDRYEFPDVLDLRDYVDSDDKENGKDEFIYLLHAVLVHSGDFHGGHYIAFINTNLKGTPKWCKFDDDVVSRVAHSDALLANFGGENAVSRGFTNAYMLVYIKKNAVEEVLCTVSGDDIPEHLKVRFESEKKRDLEKQQEKEEASNYCEITLVLDKDMRSHHEFELFDPKLLDVQNRKIKVQKNMSYKELYKFIANNMKIPEHSFRLWDFHESDDHQGMHHRFRSENARPSFYIDPSENVDEYGTPQLLRFDRMVYLEMGKLGPTGEYELNKYDKSSDSFTFLKFFNHERGQSEFKGTLILNLANDLLGAHYPEINQLIGFPPDTKLNLYTEVKPNKLVPIQAAANERIKESEFVGFDGVILVVEVANQVSPTANAEHYFRTIYNRIEVEAYAHEFNTTTSNGMTPAQPIKGTIGLDWNIAKLCAWLADELNYDFQKILPWRVGQPSEKPFSHLSSDQYRQFKVVDLLSLHQNQFQYDPCKKHVYRLYYTLLPFEFFELEKRKQINLQMLHDHFQISEISVFPKKNGSVKDILDEARTQFKFNPNGSGILRLVNVYSTANVSRLFHVLKEDQPYDNPERNSSSFMFRVEEVPKDQVELGPDEHLFPVAHFDKDPARMFGIPFFIKISRKETVADTLAKIKQALNVSDKEFEKYKFHIVMNNKVIKDLDLEEADGRHSPGVAASTEHIFESLGKFMANGEKRQSISSEPYIGIDHFNKMRGGRGGVTEKAIIIRN